MERKKPLRAKLTLATLMIIIFAISQQLHLARADSTERDPNSVNYYSCNPTGGALGGATSDGKSYATYDEVFICLFFENGGASAPEKMVFKAYVDKFATLQVKGLYNKFKDSDVGDFTVTAMADGVASRPAIFKKNLEVALILNIVVGLDQGKISFLEWRNSCYED